MASSVKANLLDDGVVDTLGSFDASDVHTPCGFRRDLVAAAGIPTAFGDMSKKRH
jgi:hypothetical protein